MNFFPQLPSSRKFFWNRFLLLHRQIIFTRYYLLVVKIAGIRYLKNSLNKLSVNFLRVKMKL